MIRWVFAHRYLLLVSQVVAIDGNSCPDDWFAFLIPDGPSNHYSFFQFGRQNSLGSGFLHQTIPAPNA